MTARECFNRWLARLHRDIGRMRREAKILAAHDGAIDSENGSASSPPRSSDLFPLIDWDKFYAQMGVLKSAPRPANQLQELVGPLGSIDDLMGPQQRWRHIWATDRHAIGAPCLCGCLCLRISAEYDRRCPDCGRIYRERGGR